MARTTLISISIDSEIQREAERVFDGVGLSMADAVTAFLKKVARERRIPFELSEDQNGKLDFSERELIED